METAFNFQVRASRHNYKVIKRQQRELRRAFYRMKYLSYELTRERDKQRQVMMAVTEIKKSVKEANQLHRNYLWASLAHRIKNILGGW